MKLRKVIGMTAGVGLGAAIIVSTLHAGPRRAAPPKPQDVTLIGQLVDLQTYMTEKCAGDDFVKCTREAVRAGVPSAVVTEEDGVVIIGMGDKGPARLLIPLAYQTVEIQGKLYDKDGVLYVDMTSAKIFKEEGEEAPQGGEEGSHEP
jgi:hypothetical protein